MIWRNREDDQQDVKSLHHVFHPGDFGGDSENVKFFDDHFLISSEKCIEFSDWNKDVIPNSQIEKSMAEVAVVNALIVRQGYPCIMVHN